jgi:tRNA U34 5-methylaminomethyl-2-thiouridine-forming methyltransferase MnmC
MSTTYDIITADGSHSIRIPEMNVTYHSLHGAIQESKHVFINAGFYGSDRFQRPEPLKIFEMGFGTGLNALLTIIEAEKTKTKVYYETLEPYPLTEQQVKEINYCRQLNRSDLQPVFEKMHCGEWEKEISISPHFSFRKLETLLVNHLTIQQFNLIYFDAFAPKAQPELWTKQVFDKMYAMLVPGGILVTYCSKGDVRRAMMAAGFEVEKLPGPPHKREMIRARKN